MNTPGWHELLFWTEELTGRAEEVCRRADELRTWVAALAEHVDSTDADFPPIAYEPVNQYLLSDASERDRLEAFSSSLQAKDVSELDAGRGLVDELKRRVLFLKDGLACLEKATDWLESFRQRRVNEDDFLQYRTRCQTALRLFTEQAEAVLRQARASTQSLIRLRQDAERRDAERQEQERRAAAEEKQRQAALARQAREQATAAESRARSEALRGPRELADIVKGSWSASFRNPFGQNIRQQISLEHRPLHQSRFRASCPMMGWECMATWKPTSGRQIEVDGLESPGPGLPPIAPMHDVFTVHVVGPDELEVTTLANGTVAWVRS